MINTGSQAKIFLADQRGLCERSSFKRWSTLSFEGFNDATKGAENQLYFLNDEQLVGGQKTCFTVERNSYIVILPVTGSVIYLDDSENETDVNVEEAIIVYVEKNTDITLINPFKNEVINYICLGINAEEPMPNNPRFYHFDFSHQNYLHSISSPDLPFQLSIGCFEGRKEAICALANYTKLFAFVITGAFEIEGRLLHEKDGLAIWDTKTVELEALSNHAVVLTLAMA